MYKENDDIEYGLNFPEQLRNVIEYNFCYTMTSFLLCLSMHSISMYARVITARTEVTNIKAVMIDFRLLVAGCSFMSMHFVIFCSSPVKNEINMFSVSINRNTIYLINKKKQTNTKHELHDQNK